MAQAQASRYDTASSGSSKTGTTTETTAPTTSTASETQQVFEALSRQAMTPESLSALEALIKTLATGGTLQQKAEVAKKKQTQQLLEGLLGQYTSEQAFSDAERLMALNLKQAMERNRPAIQRSIEGAGTSAASAQALLSQNLARDASLAAGALGAEQAKSYGGLTTNLTGQLANLASTAMDPATRALIDALQISKGAVESTQSSRSSTGQRQTITPEQVRTTTFAPAEDAFQTAPARTSTAAAESTGGLDPARYYSQLGMSGGGQSLYDFLKGM